MRFITRINANDLQALQDLGEKLDSEKIHDIKGAITLNRDDSERCYIVKLICQRKILYFIRRDSSWITPEWVEITKDHYDAIRGNFLNP